MNDWSKEWKKWKKNAKNSHFVFCFFHESVTDQINERDKSVHAGHAASKSCVPDSKTACTGHAGTLYFQACVWPWIRQLRLEITQAISISPWTSSQAIKRPQSALFRVSSTILGRTNKIPPVFYRTLSPSGPLPRFPSLKLSVMQNRATPIAEHILPLGDWFSYFNRICAVIPPRCRHEANVL